MPPATVRASARTAALRRSEPPRGSALAHDVAKLLRLDHPAAARFARVGGRHFDAVAPSSRLAHRTDVRRWAAWCAAVGCRAAPACSRDLAAFVEAFADRWRPSTLARVLGSLARVHRVHGAPDATKDEEVGVAYRAEVRRWAARGDGDPRQAAGLTAGAVDVILATLGTRVIDWRDRALLLVGRDLLARRSELVALRVEDLAPVPGGSATIRLRGAKAACRRTPAR